MRSLFLLAIATACDPHRPVLFDGIYDVKSYTLNETACTPGQEIHPAFSSFRIRGREYFGVSIYPVYPCYDGVCDQDNDAAWSLVVVEEDLDHVEIVYAATQGNSCLLSSEDKVIGAKAGEVVLESRTMKLVVTPYDANSCTTDNAKRMRSQMMCGSLLQLVGTKM